MDAWCGAPSYTLAHISRTSLYIARCVLGKFARWDWWDCLRSTHREMGSSTAGIARRVRQAHGLYTRRKQFANYLPIYAYVRAAQLSSHFGRLHSHITYYCELCGFSINYCVCVRVCEKQFLCKTISLVTAHVHTHTHTQAICQIGLSNAFVHIIPSNHEVRIKSANSEEAKIWFCKLFAQLRSDCCKLAATHLLRQQQPPQHNTCAHVYISIKMHIHNQRRDLSARAYIIMELSCSIPRHWWCCLVVAVLVLFFRHCKPFTFPNTAVWVIDLHTTSSTEVRPSMAER